MGEATKIQWADHTASPWHGCTKCAPGCENCYAEALSKRNPGTLGIWGDEGTRVKSKSFIKNLHKWQASAAKRGVTERVFPSLCDPFEDRPELVPWREEMFDAIDECPNLILMLLTKRPENIRRMWPATGIEGHAGGCGHHKDYRPNVWLYTSVSEQATADRNIPLLLQCRDLVPVLGVSAEPLLGPIDLDSGPRGGPPRWLTGEVDHGDPKLDHVIVGGESGPHARPFDAMWADDLLRQCNAAGVPAFFKQFGSNPLTSNANLHDWSDEQLAAEASGTSACSALLQFADNKGGLIEEWPEPLRVRQMPEVSHD